jgi:hypothetical protein
MDIFLDKIQQSIRREKVKKFGFILMGIILLLSGCDNGSANEPVKEENKTDYFNLAIESDR